MILWSDWIFKIKINFLSYSFNYISMSYLFSTMKWHKQNAFFDIKDNNPVTQCSQPHYFSLPGDSRGQSPGGIENTVLPV